MIEIGKYNTLTVIKAVDFGVYLDGEDRGEILLPKEYVPEKCFPNDELKVLYISIPKTGLSRQRKYRISLSGNLPA